MDLKVIFYVIISITTVAVSIVLLIPLLRKNQPYSSLDASKINVETIRQQKRELENDSRSGILSAKEFEEAVNDLEFRFLEERVDEAPVSVIGNSQIGSILTIGGLLPVVAICLYISQGNSNAIGVGSNLADSISSLTQEEFSTMTLKLKERLVSDPDDIEGWLMLGRAYFILGEFDEAVVAWETQRLLDPNNADIYANLAEAVYFSKGAIFTKQVTDLIKKTLEIDSNHPKALALSGGFQFYAGNYKASIKIWEYLLTLIDSSQPFAESVRQSISEAEKRLSSEEIKSPWISGVVSIAAELRKKIPETYSLFIVVKAIDGPETPLMVRKITVSDLPYQFQMGQDDMMTEGDISNYKAVKISLALSPSGKVGDIISEYGASHLLADEDLDNVELELQRVGHE